MKITTRILNSSINSNSSNNNNNTTSNSDDMRSTKSYLGKIRKTFRMRSARHVVSLRQYQLEQAANNNANVTPLPNNNNNNNMNNNSFNFENILNNNNVLKMMIPLLQNYTPMSSSNSSNPSSADCQQLILAALIEMRNSISSSTSSSITNSSSSTTSSSSNTDNVTLQTPFIPASSATNSPCQCIHCQLQLYIKATVTKVFENLLLAKEMKENRTAHTMTCQEKEIISKDLLASEEFSERIRLFQSLNNSSLIQVESIVRNNMELFVMISNVIPQQRSVYIASFDLPTTPMNKH